MSSFHRTNTEFTTRSETELSAEDSLRTILQNALPHLGRLWDAHLPVFITAPALARMLWFNDIYQLALNVPGKILEFGSQWGASLNILMLLKMIHEPWNAARPIISFSSFAEGFRVVSEQDASGGGEGASQTGGLCCDYRLEISVRTDTACPCNT